MPQLTYLNTAATGLLPEENIAAANELYRSLAENAATHAEHWRETQLPVVRGNIAKLTGGHSSNIALLPNFSWGMNGIVHTLKGDEKVLLYKQDYPSLTEPFKINGFDIAWIDDTDGFTISIAALKETLLTEKIDVLAISHVQWMSGYKLNLQEVGAFCKANNILFIVDATQSLGAIPTDVAGCHIDVYIASTYKWLNAGFGTAVMHLSDKFLNTYTPKVGGNNSYTMQDGKPVYIPGINSFEPGHPNMYGLAVLNSAITNRLAQGVATVQEHNMRLTQLLLDELQQLDVKLIGEHSTENRASIVFIEDAPGLWDKLKEHHIVVSLRGNIRISMHHYNTEADIQKLVAVLKEY